MNFDLTLEKPNGINQIIRFDNETNRFYDSLTGVLLLSDQLVNDWCRYSPYGKIDYNNINLLYIMMGLKCNYDCEYCHQKNIRSNTIASDFTPKKVQPFIENLSRLGVKPGRIAIWGGEPLVYWKTLKLLLPALRELYPDVNINFPTNGSLLSEEIVSFLRKYRIGYFISYDGRSSARGKSILDDETVVRALRAERGVAIMPTWNKKSIPILAIRKEFQEKNIKLNHIALYAVARCNSYNRALAGEMEIPSERRSVIEKYLYSKLFECRLNPDGESRLYKGFLGIYLDTLKKYRLGIGIDSRDITLCANSWLGDITIDADGKVLNCMNAPMLSLGNFWNKNNNKPQDLSQVFQPPIFKEKCFMCPYVSACKGGCPLIHDEDSPEFLVSCKNLQVMAIPLFKLSVEELFGGRLIKIVRSADGLLLKSFDY